MKLQFKYALRQDLGLRLAAICFLVLMNGVFGVLGYYGLPGMGIQITMVTVSSLALAGGFVVCIIADVKSLGGIYDGAKGYLLRLAPVKAYKILLARVLSIILQDSLILAVGIGGVVWHSLILSGVIGVGAPGPLTLGLADIISIRGVLLSGVFQYSYILTLIIFGVTLEGSLFYSRKGGSLLSFICVIAAAWLLSLLNLSLMPMGYLTRWGIFITVTIPAGFGPATLLYYCISLFQAALLFMAGAELLERKGNL